MDDKAMIKAIEAIEVSDTASFTLGLKLYEYVDKEVGELSEDLHNLLVDAIADELEAHRKGRFANLEAYEEFSEDFDDAIKDTFEDEIADSVIRLLDMCGGLDIDIDTHIRLKLEYNKTRERLHGKSY